MLYTIIHFSCALNFSDFYDYHKSAKINICEYMIGIITYGFKSIYYTKGQSQGDQFTSLDIHYFIYQNDSWY